MPNNGALNWAPTTATSKNIAPGYYSGGTISTSGAYEAGYNTAINKIPKLSPFEVYDPQAYYYVGNDGVHISDSIIIQITNKDFYNTITAVRSDGGTVHLKVVKFVWNSEGSYYEIHNVRSLGYGSASLSSVNLNEYVQAAFTGNTTIPGLRVRLTQ